jgi:hypothetical protein
MIPLITGSIFCGFIACNPYKLIENPPFSLGEVVYEAWASKGQKAESGITLFIPLKEEKTILLDSVYFRGRRLKLEKIQRDSYLVYRAGFKNPSSREKDLVMHANPKKEAGNTPPQLTKNNPFHLNDHEAVISFRKKGKIHYYKIKNIKESIPVQLPAKKLQPKCP